MASPPPIPVLGPAALVRQRVRRGELVLPPYPAVAARLQELARDERVGVRTLAGVVGNDVALAALVIRHASSAAFSAGGPALTIEQAVHKLGAPALANFALAASLGGAAARRGPLAHLRREQWRDALLSAVFAQELAGRRGLHPDQAFLAGLVHDLGATLALGMLEEQLEQGAPSRRDDEWHQIVADLHVELGLIVAERWNLPEALREIIANHHDAEACLRVYRPQVTLIQIVDQIVAALAEPDGTAALRGVVGLAPDERERIATLVPRVAELMATFEPPVPAERRPIAAGPTAATTAGWPVDFGVKTTRGTFRAVGLTPSVLVVHGAQALVPNWLTSVVLDVAPAPFELLANVIACDPEPRGGHRITLQPFALNGPVKVAWLAMIAEIGRRARPDLATAPLESFPMENPR